jgi:hypothetical protein
MNVYLYASNNVYRNLLTTGKAVLLEIYFNVNEMHRIKKNYKKNYIWKYKFFLEKGGMRCKCCICIKCLHATFSLKMLQIGRKCKAHPGKKISHYKPVIAFLAGTHYGQKCQKWPK